MTASQQRRVVSRSEQKGRGPQPAALTRAVEAEIVDGDVGAHAEGGGGADDVDGGTGDDEVTVLGVNPWSMKAVLGSCPDFANARSLIRKCIEDRVRARTNC